MAVFTQVSPKEASDWAQLHFGLAAVDALSPIAEGIENTNYLLSAGGQKYVFTIFEVWDLPMAEYYAALMRHLSAGGASVPAPLSPREEDGKRWQDKPALITPFVEGAWRQNPDAQECGKMGAAVAALHLSAAHFVPRMDQPRGAQWRRQTAQKLHALLPQNMRDTLKQALDADARFYDLPLPAAACHCDLFRNNVLWQDGEVAGIIDFYFGGEDALVFDLAVCICDWCWLPDLDDGGNFDDQRLGALLAGYEQLRPLCDLERTKFHDALQSAALRFWISRLYDLHFPREAKLLSPHDPQHFERIYMRARERTPLPFAECAA